MDLTPVTFADLATFPGAAMAAMGVVAFASAIFKGLSAAAKRITSIVIADAFYMTAVLYSTEPTLPIVLIAILSGMLAGMSAAALYDNLASGFDHKVVKSSEV